MLEAGTSPGMLIYFIVIVHLGWDALHHKDAFLIALSLKKTQNGNNKYIFHQTNPSMFFKSRTPCKRHFL